MTLTSKAIRHAFRLGYRVSDAGELVAPDGSIRKTPQTGLGRTLYYRANVWFKGRPVSVPIHRLAGFQLWGERALRKGAMVRHRDGNSFNNRLDNFLLGGNKENMLDKGRDHLSAIGRRGNQRKRLLALQRKTTPIRSVVSA